MSSEKVISITNNKLINSEINKKESLIKQNIHSHILQICGNSPSLGHGKRLDRTVAKLEIDLFTEMLEACSENPNIDLEIFFDSFTADLHAIFNQVQVQYRTLQEIKIKLNSKNSAK